MTKKSTVLGGVIHELGFYSSIKDIGNHESYLKKVGEFQNLANPFRVTYLSKLGLAKVYTESEEYDVVEGMILGTNALLKTNGADVELIGADNTALRLTGMSEFCVENTVEGVRPVVYGNVLYKKGDNTIRGAHIKIRSNCWSGHIMRFVTERINNKSDLYYTLEEPLTIYEYDESGKKFTIVSLEPYQKCVLSFDFKECMRKRYTVKEIADLSKDEIARIYERYLVTSNWQSNNMLEGRREAV